MTRRGIGFRDEFVTAAFGALLVIAFASRTTQPVELPEHPENDVEKAFGPPSNTQAQSYWREVAGEPSPRSRTALAYDSLRGVTVLFGGKGASGALGDTWEWDGDRWEHRSDLGPSARGGHALVYDGARGKTLLFGGGVDTAGSQFGDTWEWSGTAWTRVASTGPSPAASATMAFDPHGKRAFLFGGMAGQAPQDETWEWDGNAWKRVCADAACAHPPARAFAAGYFDFERSRFVVFGGKANDGTLLGDTWEWDGARWTQQCTAAPCNVTKPSARFGHAMAFDAAVHAGVLFSGESADVTLEKDTWHWNGVAWKNACTGVCSGDIPRAQSGHAMAYDAARQRVVMVSADTFGETWEWSGTAWARRKPVRPGVRDGHALAFDSSRGRVVLFGGLQAASAAFVLHDTWEWDGSRWSEACVDAACMNVRPQARSAHALAFDAARKTSLLFGGTSGNNVALGDTWQWNGAHWTQACTQPPCVQLQPPARFAHALAYDSARNVIVLFGGQQGGTLFDDTWEWDGARWFPKKVPDGTITPSARSRHAMAFDAKRGKTVLFGGVGNAELSDTWEWDGTTWQAMPRAVHPAARAYGMLAYDPKAGATFLFGGAGGATNFSDTWQWDGAQWIQEKDPNPPPGRTAHALTHDDLHRQLIAHGGFGNTFLQDTWRHQRLGVKCASGDECDTGQCVDGLCCNANCQSCEACNTALAGVCVPVLGAEDPSCNGTSACDGSGRCRRVDGQACTWAGDCVSGHCVDGVCCATACEGTCQACRASLKSSGPDGVCGDAKAGVDPHDQCAKTDVCGCGLDGECDGAGACRLYPKGTPCPGCDSEGQGLFGNECDGIGTCRTTMPVRCDGDHQLIPLAGGPNRDCTPFRCTAEGACFETCQSSAECADPRVCNASGQCVAPPPPPSVPSDGCAVAALAPGRAARAPVPPGGVAIGLAAWLPLALRRFRRERRERRERRS